MLNTIAVTVVAVCIVAILASLFLSMWIQKPHAVRIILTCSLVCAILGGFFAVALFVDSRDVTAQLDSSPSTTRGASGSSSVLDQISRDVSAIREDRKDDSEQLGAIRQNQKESSERQAEILEFAKRTNHRYERTADVLQRLTDALAK